MIKPKHGGARQGAGRKAGGTNANKRDLVSKTFKLPATLTARLKARAMETDSTETAIVEQAIAHYLTSSPSQSPETSQGLTKEK